MQWLVWSFDAVLYIPSISHNVLQCIFLFDYSMQLSTLRAELIHQGHPPQTSCDMSITCGAQAPMFGDPGNSGHVAATLTALCTIPVDVAILIPGSTWFIFNERLYTIVAETEHAPCTVLGVPLSLQVLRMALAFKIAMFFALIQLCCASSFRCLLSSEANEAQPTSTIARNTGWDRVNAW